VVPDRTDDSDDLPRPAVQDDALAERVSAGKHLARHRFVDDGHGRTVRTVEFRELPPTEEGNSHRAKVAGGGETEIGLRFFAGPRSRAAFDDNGQVVVGADRVER
jgi:hypothetical protein